MKKLLLSIVATSVAVVSFAQSSMLATLSHGGEISTYYGASALREAMDAAIDGDIITLSSGAFVSIDITKAVTIRGAGMGIDNLSKSEPTIISGDFNINIPAESTGKLTMEGIYHNHNMFYENLESPTFIKCRFKHIDGAGNTHLKNATFIHCKIADYFRLFGNGSASLVNCVISGPGCVSSTSSNYEFTNCIICTDRIDNINASTFKNCIIKNTDGGSDMASSCVAYNCLALKRDNDENDDIFRNMPNNTNKVATIEEVMKTYRGDNFTDDERFELTDEAKTKYIGIDGTQVGIYGGNMPFNTTPTNPQITKCNVAAKSTADGKLSVDITVGSAD